MAVLVRAHTAELSAETRDEIRRLLDEAFESEFTDEDWEHTLGGVHVLAREGDELWATSPSYSAASCTGSWGSGRVTSRVSRCGRIAGAAGTRAR